MRHLHTYRRACYVVVPQPLCKNNTPKPHFKHTAKFAWKYLCTV